jgi:hypothetical protein
MAVPGTTLRNRRAGPPKTPLTPLTIFPKLLSELQQITIHYSVNSIYPAKHPSVFARD